MMTNESPSDNPPSNDRIKQRHSLGYRYVILFKFDHYDPSPLYVMDIHVVYDWLKYSYDDNSYRICMITADGKMQVIKRVTDPLDIDAIEQEINDPPRTWSVSIDDCGTCLESGFASQGAGYEWLAKTFGQDFSGYIVEEENNDG